MLLPSVRRRLDLLGRHGADHVALITFDLGEEVTSAVEDAGSAHVARPACMVDTDDSGRECLSDGVTGANEQGHVFLQVLVCAGQHTADRVHEYSHRQLPELLTQGVDGAQQPVDVSVEHEVKGLANQVEGGLIRLHTEVGLPRPQAELDIADALAADVDHGACADDLLAPPCGLPCGY